MGLDIYVGPLTRYHTGNWETVVQQYARLNGLKCQIVRPPSKDSSPRLSADQIREAIVAWQTGLSEALKQPLKWTEDNSSDYFTEKPAWDCYSAVALLAAHDEHPDVTLPESVPEDFNKDEAYRKSTAEGFKTRYSQILFPELWLPGDNQFVFKAGYITGKELWMGWSTTLLTQLRELNLRTLKGTPEDFKQWKLDGGPKNAPFEVSVRFGMAVQMGLTEQAVMHRLPMKLDY
jgi:hypothetical protein